MEEKVNKLKELKMKLKDAHDKMARAERIYRKYEREWATLKDTAEKLDYQLAMVDGRFKKVTDKDRKPVVKVELSIAQVLDLAKKLGVQVDVGEVDNG